MRNWTGSWLLPRDHTLQASNRLPRSWRAAHGGRRFRAYELAGAYCWRTEHPQARRITLGMDTKCGCLEDADGDILVVRRRCPAAFSLTHAMWLGWCWEATPELDGRRPLRGWRRENRFMVDAVPGARAVAIWLQDGTCVERSPEGECLFYRGLYTGRLPLRNALEAGWIAEAPRGLTIGGRQSRWVQGTATETASLHVST